MYIYTMKKNNLNNINQHKENIIYNNEEQMTTITEQLEIKLVNNKDKKTIEKKVNKCECQICFNTFRAFKRDLHECKNKSCKTKICYDCLFKISTFRGINNFTEYKEFYNDFKCPYCRTDFTFNYTESTKQLHNKEFIRILKHHILSIDRYATNIRYEDRLTDVLTFLNNNQKYIVILKKLDEYEIIYYNMMINESENTEDLNDGEEYRLFNCLGRKYKYYTNKMKLEDFKERIIPYDKKYIEILKNLHIRNERNKQFIE